jgi:hypothetical protein
MGTEHTAHSDARSLIVAEVYARDGCLVGNEGDGIVRTLDCLRDLDSLELKKVGARIKVTGIQLHLQIPKLPPQCGHLPQNRTASLWGEFGQEIQQVLNLAIECVDLVLQTLARISHDSLLYPCMTFGLKQQQTGFKRLVAIKVLAT